MKKMIRFVTLSFLLLGLNAGAQTLKTIDRDSFSVKYPSTWSIDTKDEDYDPDALFSLDAPAEGATMMFMIFDSVIDTDDMLKAQEEAMTKEVIKKPTSITKFDSWGNYKGKGILIKGKILGVLKGQVKIFIYTDEHKSMLVMEQIYDSDLPVTGKEFEQIAMSFKFK
jgi:hypothetical protein